MRLLLHRSVHRQQAELPFAHTHAALQTQPLQQRGECHTAFVPLLAPGCLPVCAWWRLAPVAQAVRLHWLIMVREKARVHLPQGAFLYGALDETGTLDVGQVGRCGAGRQV